LNGAALDPAGPRFGVAALLLLAGLALLLFPNLGAAPLERAEIYFLDGARSMVESGDWLVPIYRGEPFFDKPALTYWLMALSMLWLGPFAGAARLIPALAALAVVLATLDLGRLLFDRRTAVFGGSLLASTLAFVLFGRVAMSDMLLTLWSTLAVTLALRALGPRPRAWAVPALGAVLGLGFQTKGPVALLLPGFAILLLLWTRRRDRLTLTPTGVALGTLLFAVIGLGWFALVYRRLGFGPLVHFFFRENLQRFAGETYDSGRPLWFYPVTYMAEGLPWSLFLPLALWRLLPNREPGSRFLAAWVGLMLIPLSLSNGKIDYYLLPAYPALSLLVGRLFVAVPWGRLERAWVGVALVLAALGLGLVASFPLPFPAEWLPVPAAQTLLRVVAGALALACLGVAAARPRPLPVAFVLAASAGLVFLLLTTFFLPAFVKSQPNPAIAADVSREVFWRPDARLLLCEDPSRAQRDILFHARVAVEQRCDLWPLAASRDPYLMLLRPEERASFRSIPGYREVSVHRYLPATALTFDGLAGRPEPGEMVLAANYATADPEAERKRKKAYRRMLMREQAEAAAAASDGR
jgi:4-amino-4-deoxy-L-arabinose transferase-like glycosyltransferase